MKLSNRGIIGASFFAIYSIIVFFIAGFSNDITFWIAYGLVAVAFLIIGIVMKRIDEEIIVTKNFFLNYSLLSWSAIYLGIQVLFSTVWMIFFNINYKILVVLSIVLIFMYSMLIVACSYQKNHIIDIENKTIDKTNNIKKFKVDMSICVQYAKTSNIKRIVEMLSEEFKYSDPISSENLKSIELLIEEKVNKLKELLVKNESYEIVKANVDEISNLLKERNIKCKANKK